MGRLCRYSLARPRQLGFTLLELGIVVAVIAVLMAITFSGAGFLRAAKAKQTAKDMYSLVSAAQGIARRYVKPVYNSSTLKLDQGLCWIPNVPCQALSTERCYLLNDAVQQQIKDYLRGGDLRSPYQESYEMCFRDTRVEIRTCVDVAFKDDAMFKTMAQGCSLSCTSPNFTCVALGGSLLPRRTQRLRMSYSDDLYIPIP